MPVLFIFSLCGLTSALANRSMDPLVTALGRDFNVTVAAAAAAERDHEGQWAITNTRSSMDPFLTYSDERDLREKVWRTYYSRGNNGDQHDNNAIIVDILKLRHERAQLLGYNNFAEWQVQNRMAKTPEAAQALMEAVWRPAVGGQCVHLLSLS